MRILKEKKVKEYCEELLERNGRWVKEKQKLDKDYFKEMAMVTLIIMDWVFR